MQKIPFFDVRDDSTRLSRKVIRSYYDATSQPDMTHVSVRVEQAIKEERMYECEVTVEGHMNIFSGNHKQQVKKGSGITNVKITGE